MNREALVLKALGDETRIQILELLRDGRRCVCEIVPLINASQSTISQHLRILKDAGIIELDKQGRSNYYSVTDERIFSVLDMVHQVILDNLKMQIAALEG